MTSYKILLTNNKLWSNRNTKALEINDTQTNLEENMYDFKGSTVIVIYL